MNNDREVTIIPSSIVLPSMGDDKNAEKSKKRVAAYARVSTDSEEQQTSYEAQVDYYTKYIKERNDWVFAGMYTDEGISATNTKHRDGFNQMIADALDGKIDLIVTKSVSRFARNTVDSLTTVRKLKEKGIEVYFQKENIYTLDSKGELLITIMSSLAQEESRSISENVTWGQRKRFQDGKISLPYKRFLGYRCGADGFPEIVPEEAEIIRLIYKSFIEGMTPYRIACMLTEKGIPTPGGKKNWHGTTVESILMNEKYKGAALLQKSFTVDFLTKKKKINEGEVPQYYIEHSHEAIIEPEEFELVQAELSRRKRLGKQYHSKSIFAARIVCADCGGFYGSKVWHSNSQYKQTVWQCNKKYSDGHRCSTPHLDENEIKEHFLIAYNRMLANKDVILDACRTLQDALTDCSQLDSESNSITIKMNAIAKVAQKLISDNSQKVHEQKEYLDEYNKYAQRYDELKEDLRLVRLEKAKRIEKRNIIGGFMFEMSERQEYIREFDEQLWTAVIDTVVVSPTGRLTFTFKDGTTIEA